VARNTKLDSFFGNFRVDLLILKLTILKYFGYLTTGSVLLPEEQTTGHRIKRQLYKQLHVCRQSEKTLHKLEAL
jgi:hypothetical protein